MTELVRLRAGVYARQSRNKTKSIDEQLAAGTAVARENGWQLIEAYQDGSSASRYARQGRDDWERVLTDIAAGALDVLILWEASRGDRTLTTWSGLLDLCRERRVSIYIVADERIYDPRKHKDWKSLATAGVDSAGESDLLSVRVLRGQAGAAAAGRPSHGRTPYGYVRRFDPATGELVGQEPDPLRAPIVAEVFERLAKGDPMSAIVRDFDARGVPTSGGAKRWYRARLAVMAGNRAYLGERIYNGTVNEGSWPALVEPAVFHAVQRVLSDPARRSTTRPGRAVHLLSFLATCGPCGAALAHVQGRYRCERGGHVNIAQAAMDDFIEDMVFEKLEQPNVYEQLRQAGSADDRALLDAENEAARLDGQLKTWRLSAARGQTSPETMAVVEAELVPQIKAAQRRAAQAQIPPELRAILEPGADVRTRWKDAPVAARRRALAFMATIVVGRSTTPRSREFDHHRLGESRWAGDPQTWGEKWKAESV